MYAILVAESGYVQASTCSYALCINLECQIDQWVNAKLKTWNCHMIENIATQEIASQSTSLWTLVSYKKIHRWYTSYIDIRM